MNIPSCRRSDPYITPRAPLQGVSFIGHRGLTVLMVIGVLSLPTGICLYYTGKTRLTYAVHDLPPLIPSAWVAP